MGAPASCGSSPAATGTERGDARAEEALDGRGAMDPDDGAVVKLQGHGGLLRFPVQNETEKERVENREGKEGREKEGKKKRAGEVGPGRRWSAPVSWPVLGRLEPHALVAPREGRRAEELGLLQDLGGFTIHSRLGGEEVSFGCLGKK